MFLNVTTQLGFVITSRIATGAVAANAHGSADAGAGLTAYSYAYQLFQLPYAIIAVSLITVLLPQMSAFAADQRWDEVRAGFSRTLRVSALILVPLSLAISLYATEITVLLFAHGNTGDSDAANIGYILMVMSLGLLPFSVFQLMLRVFYALGDTRTPAFLGIANIAVHGVLALTASWLLPPHFVVVGVAGGFMSSFLVGVFLGGLSSAAGWAVWTGAVSPARWSGSTWRPHPAWLWAGACWFCSSRGSSRGWPSTSVRPWWAAWQGSPCSW